MGKAARHIWRNGKKTSSSGSFLWRPYSAESGLNPDEQIHLKAEELLGSVMFKLSVDKTPRGASGAAGKS